MFIRQTVRECDFTGKEYDHPVDGAGAIARGATGRWCVVMHAGPEYIIDNNITVHTSEEAYEMIRARRNEEEGQYDYPDF